MKLLRRTLIPRPLSQVFPFFAAPQNLEQLTTPWLRFQIREAPARPIQTGDRIRYRIRLMGVPMGWVTLIKDVVPGRSFVDEQERGPYRRWEHTHRFTETDTGVLMEDEVDYELPLGPLGTLAHALFVQRQLCAIFDYRALALRRIFDARPL